MVETKNRNRKIPPGINEEIIQLISRKERTRILKNSFKAYKKWQTSHLGKS
jgi:hypothetical protein